MEQLINELFKKSLAPIVLRLDEITSKVETQKEWYTTEEAAKYLDVSPSTIRTEYEKWVHSGGREGLKGVFKSVKCLRFQRGVLDGYEVLKV
jgi:excisionase family DNA binding protein